MRYNVYTELRKMGVRINARGQIHKDDIQKAEPFLLNLIDAEPMNVQDTEFQLDQIAKNMALFKKLERKNGHILKDFGEYQLCEYPTHIALLHMPSQSVAYIVRFEKRKMFGKNAITQVMLWRQIGNDFVENLKIDGMKLTSYVFFKVLFANNDCIVTDSMQTGMGKRFWGDRIGNALSLGYPVYYLNQNTGDKILITKDNKNEVFEKYDVWSDQKNAMAKRIAICKEKFWKPNIDI